MRSKVNVFYDAECENCTSVAAITRCTDCDEQYCEGCFQKLHRTQKKKLHQRVDFAASGIYNTLLQSILVNNLVYNYLFIKICHFRLIIAC